MKKILIVGLLALSTTAFAHGPHGYWRPHPSGGWNWVAPAVIGGVIGYEIARPPVYNPPVVVQQPPVIIQSQSPVIWIDGVAYTKQIMIINGVQQEVLIRN